MGIITIRKVAKNILTPMIVILVLAMAIGLFTLPMYNPGVIGKENPNYQGPSATVNGEAIKDEDFNSEMQKAANQMMQMAQYGMQYSDAQLRDAALSRCIQNLALEQEMRKVNDKIKVNNGDIDSAMKKYFPTPEELQSFMDQQGKNKDEVRKLVADQLRFINFLNYKAGQFKIKLTKNEVSDAMHDSYENITISHILIALKDQSGKATHSDAEALKLANDVYQKASSGGDFTKLAQQYSEDPGSKDKGGKYGPMPLGQFKSQMDKDFVAGSLALKVGQIGKPVKTQFGYHIIKLDARDMSVTGKDYDIKRKDIQSTLLAKKTYSDPKFTSWLEDVNRKANDNLEIKDPALRAYRLVQREKWAEAAKCYEEAIKKAYYKQKAEIYQSAAEAYLKLSQPQNAITILEKAPKNVQDNVDYKVALANVYKADNKTNNAKLVLTSFGKAHQTDRNIHMKLRAVFEEWNMKDLVANEDKVLAQIDQAEKEAIQLGQQNVDKRNGVTSAPTTAPNQNPSPAPTSTTKQ